MAEWVNPDGTITFLKKKHIQPKHRGRYAGGERPDKRGHRKRNKKGVKSYVYGSWTLYVSPTGKKVMKKVL